MQETTGTDGCRYGSMIGRWVDRQADIHVYTCAYMHGSCIYCNCHAIHHVDLLQFRLRMGMVTIPSRTSVKPRVSIGCLVATNKSSSNED